MKWKYVYHRRIAHEKELSKEAPTYNEIIELNGDAQLVKEFMVKIPIGFLSLSSGVRNDVIARGLLN